MILLTIVLTLVYFWLGLSVGQLMGFNADKEFPVLLKLSGWLLWPVILIVNPFAESGK